MESHNFPEPKHVSVPTILKKNETKQASKTYSSVTHPSMFSRNKDHLDTIFKKINNDVLSRLPLRLDPNIEFSDDDDEDESAVTAIKKDNAEDINNKGSIFEGKENKLETMKTPDPPRSSSVLLKNIYSQEKKTSESHGKRINRQSLFPGFSVSKVGENSQQSYKPVSASKDSVNIFLKPTDNMLHSTSKQKQFNVLSKDNFEREVSDNAVKIDSSLPNEIIQVNNKIYNVLSILGSGGSCKVYSVYDVQDKARVAIKRVNLKDADPAIRKGFEQEIEYLQKLQSSNRVIKMYDYEYRDNELLLVLEHGDIDFAKYLSNEAKLKRLTPLKIKFYWAQMIEAVDDIHKYGIVHSDLKPANFLLVAGSLKLIDFGIATSVPEDKTSTFRDTHVGTLNYMSPEAITQMSGDNKQQCFKIGVKSDIWSLGCILYNLVYGVTPFQHIKSLMQKIYAITNEKHEIPFKPVSDPLLLEVLKLCLKRNPKERASVKELLNHPYLSEDNIASASTLSANTNSDLQNVLKQMQILTPRRMRYVTKVVQELSEKSNA